MAARGTSGGEGSLSRVRVPPRRPLPATHPLYLSTPAPRCLQGHSTYFSRFQRCRGYTHTPAPPLLPLLRSRRSPAAASALIPLSTHVRLLPCCHRTRGHSPPIPCPSHSSVLPHSLHLFGSPTHYPCVVRILPPTRSRVRLDRARGYHCPVHTPACVPISSPYTSVRAHIQSLHQRA